MIITFHLSVEIKNYTYKAYALAISYDGLNLDCNRDNKVIPLAYKQSLRRSLRPPNSRILCSPFVN